MTEDNKQPWLILRNAKIGNNMAQSVVDWHYETMESAEIFAKSGFNFGDVYIIPCSQFHHKKVATDEL